VADRTDDIRPFRIDVADEVLADLRARLANTRWPDREVVDDWSQGAPLAYVRELAEYWRDGYDWRAREASLNRWDQYVTNLSIDGLEPLDIHFVHARSPHPDALPLVITHGWPGSIVEFQRVLEPLTRPELHGGDPADAFHVIAPSLPGYAFSAKPTARGCTAERIAELWAALMARLGYDRYVAQGGDWGSVVTSLVGATDPSHCAGIHITLSMLTGPQGQATEPEELRAVERLMQYKQWDSGYSTQQKTRPQTLGYGLHDSPAGQLAWIVEKLSAWTDNDGDPADVLGRDAMLDDVTLYWVTGTATSSARLYWESFGNIARLPVEVPTGVAVYPGEIIPPVRKWMGKLFPNITHWAEHDRGGHFAAWEVPDAFVADVRECFRALR
jgi:pimeloyl-ACP methyl ester carboxylesterase